MHRLMKISRLIPIGFILASLMGCSSETDILPDLSSSLNQPGSQSNNQMANLYTDPVVVAQGDSACIEIIHESKYTDPNGTVFACEPKTTVKVIAPQDTVYAKDYDSMNTILENISVSSSVTNNDITTEKILRKYGVGNKNRMDITFDLSYEIYHHLNSQSTAIEMPHVKATQVKCLSVNAERETTGIKPVLMTSGSSKRYAPYEPENGSQPEIYTVSALFNVDLEGVGLQPITNNIVFDIRFFVVVETPKLVAINYRKGYVWFEPHDNIPLTYCYILYRDSVFSDGSVHTSQAYTGKTSMEWALDIGSAHGHYDQRKEDVRGVTVYYFAVQDEASETDIAYCKPKLSRKIAVPDISVVTLEKRAPNSDNPEQLDLYPGYDVNAPNPGWYWRDFFYRDNAYIYNDYAGGGGFLTKINITSAWYNHLIYVEDGLNGGQLVTFLGDENDIDDVDFRPQFDFSFTEEETTMPTGEPAKVFSHQCITTFLGRQFHYEVVDTVYQYTTPPF